MKPEIFKHLLYNIYRIFSFDKDDFPTPETFLKHFPEVYTCFRELKEKNDFSLCDICDSERKRCCSFMFFNSAFVELTKAFIKACDCPDFAEEIEKEFNLTLQ